MCRVGSLEALRSIVYKGQSVCGLRAAFTLTQSNKRSVLAPRSNRQLHLGLKISRSSSTSARTKMDPYSYTSGRWLHRNETESKARYLKFEFQALCKKAIKLCPGSCGITQIEKTEGGFNRVFLFVMDSGARIVARLPMSVAGPPRLTTNSEVATITYSKSSFSKYPSLDGDRMFTHSLIVVKNQTSIPVPTILDWSDTTHNEIGAEYIFMIPAEGVQLQRQWEEMNPVEHLHCIESVTHTMRQMTDLQFPAYGSIYFDDAPIPNHQKRRFVEGFCIGPLCSSRAWNCGAGEGQLYRNNDNKGPCRYSSI